MIFTEECEAKDNYIMCERCTESVHKQLYDLHQMEDYCRGNSPKDFPKLKLF